MIIALFPNTLKIPSKAITVGIREFLTHRGVTVVVEDLEAAQYGAAPLSSVDPKQVDFRISLGGDGTILRLVHSHPELQAPILGINLGGLGFMADIPVNDIYSSLQDLLNGNYHISERLMMNGQTANGEVCFAVNELVIHRAQNPCLVDLAPFYVDRDLSQYFFRRRDYHFYAKRVYSLFIGLRRPYPNARNQCLCDYPYLPPYNFQ